MTTEHLRDNQIKFKIRTLDAVSKMRNPRGATVYVARVNKRGELRNSRPCSNCAATLNKLGIKQVYHT